MADEITVSENSIDFVFFVALVLSCVGLCLHVVSSRVLWMLSVRHKFGQLAMSDLHHVMLSVSVTTILQAILFIVLGLNAFVFQFELYRSNEIVCVLSVTSNVAADLLIRLLVVHLAMRVCLNRSMARAHRLGIPVCCALVLLVGALSAVFLTTPMCTNKEPAMWMIILYESLDQVMSLTGVGLSVAAFCVMRMRRRRNVPVQMHTLADAEDGEEHDETLMSHLFIKQVENLALTIAAVLSAGFAVKCILLIIAKNLQFYFAYIVAMTVEVLSALISGILYLFMYPGFKRFAKASCSC